LLQHAHPPAEFEIRRTGDKEMNVIGHNDEAANGDTVFVVSAFRETDKRVMHRIDRQQRSPPIGASRYEKNGIGWEEQVKSRRDIGVFVHWRGENHADQRIAKQRCSQSSSVAVALRATPGISAPRRPPLPAGKGLQRGVATRARLRNSVCAGLMR
jgi:hypothetical protein